MRSDPSLTTLSGVIPFPPPHCQDTSNFLYTLGEKLTALYFLNANKWEGSHNVLNLLSRMAIDNLAALLRPLRRPFPGSVLLPLVLT